MPTAQPQQPPPAAEAPANPAPKPAAPKPPAPQPPPVDQPAADPPPAPQPEPPPAELPLPADIKATPPTGVELTPGGSPVDLPITVRNNGETKSKPVTVALNLPRGVSAVDSAGGGGTTMSSAAPRVAAQGGERVKCPAGTGKVSCSTTDGLAPDETATLVFRLVADETAQPGQITGTVSSGGTIPVNIKVPVKVEVRDGVDLLAKSHGWHITVNVTNTGDTTEPVTVTIDQALWHHPGFGHGFDCTIGDDSTTCTSEEALEPGQEEHFHGVVHNWDDDDGEIHLQARLGAATDSQTVEVWCFLLCGISVLPGDETPPSEPTEPSEPSTPASPDEGELPVVPEPTESSEPDDLPGLPDLLPDESSTTTTTTTSTSPLHKPATKPATGPKGVDGLLSRLLGF